MSETLGTSSRPAAAPRERAAPGAIDASIVIVSYNSGELLERCLASLERATGALHTEVLVVDNASRDDSVERVRARFPSVRLAPRDRNYGFASSVNVGMRMAGGRVIVWLNPDCELSADSLAALVDTLDARPEVGVVGPAIAWPDGALQPAAQAFPSPLRLVFRSLGLRRLGEIGWVRALLRRVVPRSARMVRGYLDALEPGTEPKDTDWITGACFATRSDVVARVGGLDEAFFMYCEDTDYCQRVRAAGWAVHYLPAVRVLHVGGASSEHNPLTDFYHRESLLLYFARYARGFWMVRAWYLLSCGGHGLAATVASWFGGSRPERWWRLCALALASREALRVRPRSEYPAH